MEDVFTRITLGQRASNRIFADLAPARREAATGEETSEDAGALVREIAAVLRYTRFDYNNAQGNIYGLTMGTTREEESFRYGIFIPYDHVDFDNTRRDADSLSITPFFQWIPIREPVTVYVGPYLFFNYTVMNHAPDFIIAGAAMSGSVEKRFEHLWLRIGAAGEYLQTDIDHSSDHVFRFRYGGSVGFPILGERVEGRVYAVGTLTDVEFLGGDDDFGSVGCELSARISEAFAINGGLLTSIEHEDLESYTAYLAAVFLLP